MNQVFRGGGAGQQPFQTTSLGCYYTLFIEEAVQQQGLGKWKL